MKTMCEHLNLNIQRLDVINPTDRDMATYAAVVMLAEQAASLSGNMK